MISPEGNEENHNQEIPPFSYRCKILSKRVCLEIKSDSDYFILFFCAFQLRIVQVLMVVCVLLWVTNFVDTGYLEEEDDAKRIY